MHLSEWDTLLAQEQRSRIVQDANELFYEKKMRIGDRSFSNDCSGYVSAVFFKNGIDFYLSAKELNNKGNGVYLIYEYVLKNGFYIEKNDLQYKPKQGDLIFFSNTYDRNRDGINNDSFTHIGIVEKLHADGTLTFLHKLGGSFRKGRLNTQQKWVHKNESQTVVNSYLRRRRHRNSLDTTYLASTLLEGYGVLVKDFVPSIALFHP